MQHFWNKYKSIIIILILIIITDLLSKILISSLLVLNKPFCIINNFFYLTYSKNYGAAFSILQNNRFLLIIISFLILFIIINYLKKNYVKNKFELIGYSLVICGLIGNLIDRIIYGYVIDFFDFYIFGYEFAIFNIADCAIVIGIIILIIAEFVGDKNGDKSRR